MRSAFRLRSLFTIILAALPLAALGTASVPKGDIPNGKAAYAKLCVACHGEKAEGKRAVQSPALHTQEAWYIASQLQKFRTGQRGTNPKDAQGALMRPIAMSIPSDQAVLDVAEYIASIDGPVSDKVVKGDAMAGAATYKKVCASCHGENGRGKPELKSPALAGQNDWYMVDQLVKFRSGYRGGDPKDITGAQMRAIALSLPDDKAMNDVAAYIATLK